MMGPYSSSTVIAAYVWVGLGVLLLEPRCEKTGLRGFRPGLTQTRLYNYRGWLEA